MVTRALPLADTFADRWRSFGAPTRMLLAVSGGADSIAMLNLAASLRDAGAILRVATVDHGLRPASADDARFVQQAAAALDVPAAILKWDGDKPSTGVQAAARAARYRLLAQEARLWRADAILTAHTADDQAETVLMRMAHRSRVRGLGGMAPEILIADGANPPHRLLRPLLGQRPAKLRAFLKDLGAAFIDDPSNDDPRYERVRARRSLVLAAHGEEATGALLALADDARRLTSLLDRIDDARLCALDAQFLADGSVRLLAQKISPPLDAPLAARLIGAVGGGETADIEAAGLALEAALGGRRSTLAGALVGRAGACIFIVREPAAVLGRKGEAEMMPMPIAPGGRQLWDRRFIIENTFGVAAEIRPLGAAAQSLNADHTETLAAAPGLWAGSRLAAFPGDDGPGDAAFQSLAKERFQRRVVRH